ncbi:MAG: helix-turn-helix transcriptional regulator [Bacteroidota bacterium]
MGTHNLWWGACSSRTCRVALPFCNLSLKIKKPLHWAYPKQLKTVGDHLRKVRLDRGLWQVHVAQKIGVTENSIMKWENNISKPKIMHWPDIVRFLGYDPEIEEGNSLAVCLRNYRRLHGLSRRKLAPLIGVDETTVLWWERGTAVKLKRSHERLLSFFEQEGIENVEIPLFRRNPESTG